MPQSLNFSSTAKAGQVFFRTPYTPSAVTVAGSNAGFTAAAGGFNLDSAATADQLVVATVSIPDSYAAMVRAAFVDDIAVSATTGTLPTADGIQVIANAASPTVAELLGYCRELEAKVEAITAAMRASFQMSAS